MDNDIYYILPEHMREGMKAFIEIGQPPGDFLRLVLENNYYAAAGCADDINKHRLYDYIYFLYNHAPNQCHGSRIMVNDWIEQGGMQGIREKANAINKELNGEVSE